jgi:hypothetical protein
MILMKKMRKTKVGACVGIKLEVMIKMNKPSMPITKQRPITKCLNSLNSS